MTITVRRLVLRNWRRLSGAGPIERPRQPDTADSDQQQPGKREDGQEIGRGRDTRFAFGLTFGAARRPSAGTLNTLPHMTQAVVWPAISWATNCRWPQVQVRGIAMESIIYLAREI